MGSPNIDVVVKDNNAAIKAVVDACNEMFKKLDNDENKAIAYINAHTTGIIQTITKDSKAYSKFSDDYSLDALDKSIDTVVKLAVDGIKANAGDDNSDLAVQSANDFGSLVKAMLGLAATSSSTEENLQVTFNYIIAGHNNYAVYYAYNSATVAAQNAWGNKNITVIANTYYIAIVKPNLAITRAKNLQKDLDTWTKLNDKYDDALVSANKAQERVLIKHTALITAMKKKVQSDIDDENKKELALK